MNVADARAAIYACFSSDKQSDRSIEDQLALCRAFCEREGLRVVAIYDDRAISGASTVNRPGWLKLMQDANAGKFDIVVAEALDRISRDQEDLAGIYKRLRFRQIEIWTVQDGVAGEIHVGVEGLVGALYLKDLAQKTKRGQAGVVRDGRHNGGRCYGYRPVAGRPGVLEIQEEEAAVVRRIFDNYAKGRSSRDIAAELNHEGTPGPRGGPWNASTIGGSRKRANGVLQNALYVGRVVWNRQSFIKDPETGRRVSRPNPQFEWMTADVPELRIIDHEMWEKVRQRREERTIDGHYSTRPRHLFSGLLKCGRCGSGYIVSGADKRGRYLRCSRMLETGLCNNKRTIGLQWVESQIIQGIEAHFASPDLIAEYVREYHREWTKLRDSADRRRSELSRSLAGIKRDTKLAVDALLHNPTSRSIQERLAELEKERDKAEARLADVAPPPIFEFHPNMADSYRKKVQDLRAALAACDEEDRADATAAIRELVEKVTIIPSDPYKPVELKIHGRLATLLEASREGAIKRPESMGGLVAGVGFEPTTFRL